MTDAGATPRGAHLYGEDIGRIYDGVPYSPTKQAALVRVWGWWYFAEHMFRQLRSYLVSVFAFDLGQLALYLFAMGLGLGAIVDANSGQVDGVSYLTFVAPALVISGAMMTMSQEMTYPVMGGFKWRRLYFGAAATPVSAAQIAIGVALPTVVRLHLQGAAGLVFLWAFGAAPSPGAWLLVPVSVLAALAFGIPLQAYAATLRDEGFQFSFIQRFIVMPMFLFAGTFFPLANMPAYLHWIGWISPVWHGTELARLATYGHAVTPHLVAVHLGYLAALAALGVAAAVRVYRRRLSE